MLTVSFGGGILIMCSADTCLYVHTSVYTFPHSYICWQQIPIRIILRLHVRIVYNQITIIIATLITTELVRAFMCLIKNLVDIN